MESDPTDPREDPVVDDDEETIQLRQHLNELRQADETDGDDAKTCIDALAAKNLLEDPEILPAASEIVLRIFNSHVEDEDCEPIISLLAKYGDFPGVFPVAVLRDMIEV
jgi:hypothetical protein